MNSSFDDFAPGTSLTLPADWQTDFNSADVVSPSNDGDIHTGDGSVVYQLTQSRTDADIFQIVAASENCCYDLEFWAKGSTGGGSTGNLTATVEFLDAMDNALAADTLVIHGGSLDSNSWTSYRLPTGPSPAGTTQVKVTVAVHGHGKAARIDDIQLTTGGCGGFVT